MFSEIDNKIKNEIYKAFNKMGAGIDLLSIIGSWKDTLDDEEILELLEGYNSDKPLFDGEIIINNNYIKHEEIQLKKLNEYKAKTLN